MKREWYGKRVLMLVLALGMGTFTGCAKEESDRDDHKDKHTSYEDASFDIDKVGGMRIVYQTVEENPSEQEMEDTVEKIRKRALVYSVEAEVYMNGKDQITVEIPSVDDAETVLKDLGKPGSLEFIAMSDNDGQPGEVVLTGSDVEDAQAATQNSSLGEEQYVVELKLTEEGTEKFGEATASHIGEQIWIMYDEQQISAPVVQSAIYDGKPVITGMANYEEAEELATLLRIGALTLELEEVKYEVVH